jgi:hypothetical protein
MARAIAVVAVVLACAVPPSLAGQAPRVLEGQVLVSRDSTPLSGVRVRVLDLPQATATDARGRFRLDQLPRVALRLVFERIGIRPDTLAVGADQATLVVYLEAAAVQLGPVVSTAQPSARERFDRVAQTSTVTLEPVELKQVPGVAEPDVVRVVQLLPGTVAKNDFSTGLNVRGGENDQNLIRLDGIPVFNPTHLGGLFSTFDPSALRSVEFITGGFPAGYGGRLSSVLDITLLDGDAERPHVRGALSVLSAKALVDGPVGKTGLTYLIGARRTYADAFADAFSDDPFTYYFADLIAKASLRLPGGGTLAATGYWGRDALDLPWIEASLEDDRVDFALNWGNRLVGLTYRQSLGPVVLEHQASVSEFNTRQAFEPDILSFNNSARVLSLQTALAASGRRHQLRLGGGYERFRMLYDTRNDAIGQGVANLAYRPQVWSAFLDEQWKPTEFLLLRPGVRVEHVTGAEVTSVAPRIALKAFVTRSFALTGSAGRYYQAIQSLSDQELPLNIFDIWIGADATTPVSRAEHLVAGFEQWFGRHTSLAVEGYFKTFDQLAIRDPFDDPKVQGDEFTIGDGDARGLDVLLRRHMGQVQGWIAYSYAEATRRTPIDTFPPGHDRRHSVDIVLEAPGPLGSRLGARWGYGSPLPYTGIDGAWLHREYNPVLHAFDEFEEESFSTTINRQRFPHYSRLDVSLRWEFHKWGGIWRPYVQVVNAYNRQNVFVYRHDYRAVPPTRSGLTQLPVLPTLGVEFEF